MKQRSVQAKRAFWPMVLSVAAIAALLLGSWLLGPANPDALPLNHLEISEVIPEGKGRMDASAFINGRRIAVGDRLGETFS